MTTSRSPGSRRGISSGASGELADGVAQARQLGAALQQAGTAVEFGSFPGEGLRGHAEINRRLGDPDYAATATVDAWLRSTFGG